MGKSEKSGIDGVIIRLGYGSNSEDKQLKYNISECNRLKIPYGVYIYSYAYNANFAYKEANNTCNILSQVKLNLSFPIYYNIENFKDWTDVNGEIR